MDKNVDVNANDIAHCGKLLQFSCGGGSGVVEAQQRLWDEVHLNEVDNYA